MDKHVLLGVVPVKQHTIGQKTYQYNTEYNKFVLSVGITNHWLNTIRRTNSYEFSFRVNKNTIQFGSTEQILSQIT